jgi:hypothetical protein
MRVATFVSALTACATIGLATSAIAASSGVDYIDACAASLIPTQINYTSNDVVKLIYLNELLSNASSQQNINTNGQAYAGLFSGGLQGAQAEQQALQTETGLSLDHQHQLALIASYLTPTAGSTFTGCVQAAFNQAGLHISVVGSDANSESIEVKYVPTAGDNRSYRIAIQTDGKVIADPSDFEVSPSGADPTIFISRVNPSVDLHIIVKILSVPARPGDPVFEQGTAQFLYVPPIYTVRAVTDGQWKITNSVQSDCESQDGDVRGPETDSLSPDPGGYTFDSSKTTPITERMWNNSGYSLGPDSGMKVDSNLPTLVNGFAVCERNQNNWNTPYHVAGHLTAWETRTVTTVSTPPDNGQHVTMNTFPPAR